MGCNYKDWEKLQKSLQTYDDEMARFIEACSKDLAARLLAKVIKRTPVGDYTKEIEVTAKRKSSKHNKGDVYKKRVADGSGKTGGTLRRGWTSNSHEEAASGSGRGADPTGFASYLKVHHFGDTYVINIVNPVEYASYVENGHRTRGGKGWVAGKFMLTMSENEIQAVAPAMLERKIAMKLGDCLK